MNVNDILIQTPMMALLRHTVTRWTHCGFTGGLIIGDARLGKSWALRSLGSELLTTENEPIPVFSISMGERDHQTLRAVFLRVAQAITQTAFGKSTTADNLQEAIFHRVAEAALGNRRRQVVLVVDEAQWLTIDQLAVFAELFNDQDQIHNRLMVIFIANQQKFQPIATLLLEPENEYLRERFFHHIHPFHGLRTLEELRHCLAFLDAYPIAPGNTRSVVEYHCAPMCQDRVSLADLAGTIWSVYDEEYAKPLQLRSWGMTYFQRAISILLMDYLSSYWCNDQEAIRDMAYKSIAASGIVPSLLHVA
jgi:hypothetical protein